MGHEKKTCQSSSSTVTMAQAGTRTLPRRCRDEDIPHRSLTSSVIRFVESLLCTGKRVCMQCCVLVLLDVVVVVSACHCLLCHRSMQTLWIRADDDASTLTFATVKFAVAGVKVPRRGM